MTPAEQLRRWLAHWHAQKINMGGLIALLALADSKKPMTRAQIAQACGLSEKSLHMVDSVTLAVPLRNCWVERLPPNEAKPYRYQITQQGRKALFTVPKA